MTPRYRRARGLAGLSLGQAAKLLQAPDLLAFGSSFVQAIEGGAVVATDSLQRRMAEVYGCSPAWLQGVEPEVPESTRKMLRGSDISPTERDDLLELIGSIKTRSEP